MKTNKKQKEVKETKDVIKEQTKKLAICWIGIGDYNFMFENFYKTFKEHFGKDCERTFIIFTDRPEITDGLDDCLTYTLSNACQNKEFILFRKFKYLMIAEDKFLDFDYVAFMNGNMLCQQDVPISSILFKDRQYAVIVHPTEYKFLVNQRFNSKYTTTCFIPDYEVKYKQAGWFVCTSDAFLRMANTIEGWRHLDKAIGGDKYVQKHDEIYYNKYMYYHEYESILHPAQVYLCPSFWSSAPEAKMIQVSKKDLFPQNGFHYEDGKMADMYQLQPDKAALQPLMFN